jgi:hypothetical protein
VIITQEYSLVLNNMDGCPLPPGEASKEHIVPVTLSVSLSTGHHLLSVHSVTSLRVMSHLCNSNQTDTKENNRINSHSQDMAADQPNKFLIAISKGLTFPCKTTNE